MEEEESFCRFCLTFDDGSGFKPLSEEILKKVAGLNIAIVDATGVICRKCNADIETAWRTCNRILDAQDYFESLSEQQKAATKPAPKTSKIVYECDCYLATFKNIKSLEAHIAEHDLELDSETTESKLLRSFLWCLELFLILFQPSTVSSAERNSRQLINDEFISHRTTQLKRRF